MFRKILIANRGEIAVRIARACREMGIEPVAVYSDADAGAMHVREMREAYRLGPAPARESYLDIPALMEAVRRSGADALHPGYGFLSERAELAQACAAAGVAFIGPSAEVIRLLGDKLASKELARNAGVPVVPGTQGRLAGQGLKAAAKEMGYPILVKAAAGGGGKGMRVVREPGELETSVEAASREAGAAFGDATVFLERYIERPRHVEVQILADSQGNCVALGERECSLQRRHQKIWEESPSTALDDSTRTALLEAGVRAARAAGYVNAGTVEFLLAADCSFYFLEVNTRLQVEHPVTELVTGLDLVQLQIRIAAGEPLPFTQEQVLTRGTAIEVRLYAEDPASGYLPTTGRITRFEIPAGPGIRVDSGVAAGDEVGIHYDPMLAKLIVHAPDRAAACARLSRALADTRIEGLKTNLEFLRWLAGLPEVRRGEVTTAFLEEHPYAPSAPAPPGDAFWVAAGILFASGKAGAAPWRISGVGIPVRLDAQGEVVELEVADLREGRWRVRRGEVSSDARMEVLEVGRGRLFAGEESMDVRWDSMATGGLWVRVGPESAAVRWAPPPSPGARAPRHEGPVSLTAPMPGAILRVEVKEGDLVEAFQRLLVLEAMKMEHALVAPEAGRVRRLPYQAGDVVPLGAVLVEMEEE